MYNFAANFTACESAKVIHGRFDGVFGLRGDHVLDERRHHLSKFGVLAKVLFIGDSQRDLRPKM
jgi:hypothetical protein